MTGRSAKTLVDAAAGGGQGKRGFAGQSRRLSLRSFRIHLHSQRGPETIAWRRRATLLYVHEIAGMNTSL